MNAENLSPGWAATFFFAWLMMLILPTAVVVINLWGMVNGIFYSGLSIFVFTGLSIGIIYLMTQCQRIAWPKD